MEGQEKDCETNQTRDHSQRYQVCVHQRSNVRLKTCSKGVIVMVFKTRNYFVYRPKDESIKRKLSNQEQVTIIDLAAAQYRKVSNGFIIVQGTRSDMLLDITIAEHSLLGDVVDLEHEGVFVMTITGWEEVK